MNIYRKNTTHMTKLDKLRRLRDEHTIEAAAILTGVKNAGRSHLTSGETTRFHDAKAAIKDLTEQIDDLEAEERRQAEMSPELKAEHRATTRGCGSWAERAAKALHQMGGEARAVNAGSVDIPTLISPAVTSKSRPSRLIDLLVTRDRLESNVFDYLRQTVRTTNAAPVPDYGNKPTSIYTVESIEDRARVIAHLSQPIAQRYYQDFPELVRFLETEMVEGLLDSIENQIVSGSGNGEHMTGLLTVPGTAAVAYTTDLPTTLRRARTTLELIGVHPTAYVLHPSDVEAIDLLRYNVDYDPEAATDNPQKYLLDGYVNSVTNSGNIFGDASIARVSSTSVPQGTALLGDFSQLKLMIRENVRLDVDVSGEQFTTNTALLRAEARVGVAHLRPASFAKINLTP